MLFSSVDGENDAFWKRWRHQNRHYRAPHHSTGRHTTPPWVSKMADRRFNFAPISRVDILKYPCAEFIWACALRVWKRFQNGYIVVVWSGENDTKTISVDANLFENPSKTAPFWFENGLVWTGPKSSQRKPRMKINVPSWIYRSKYLNCGSSNL